MKENSMDFTFLADLHKEFAPPEGGVLSRILQKDGKVNITLFGFLPDVTPVTRLPINKTQI